MGLPGRALVDMNMPMPSVAGDAWRLTLCRVNALLEMENYPGAVEEVRAYRNCFKGEPGESGPLLDELLKYGEVKTVSPRLAAGFSALLPGAGQVYAGRRGDGVLSFLAVAGAGAASVLSFMYGYNDLGGMFAFFSGLFYGGNIYGAWNSARRSNRDRWNGFRDRIREDHIPSYDPDIDLRRHGFIR